MKLGYVIIYVEDVVTTTSFYERAFGLKLRFLHESNQYAEMETGQTTLAFVNENFVTDTLQFSRNRSKDQAAGAEIAFVVSDVEGSFKRAIDSGAKEIAKPTKKPWGQVVSYLRDNNGFIVEVCSPMHE